MKFFLGIFFGFFAVEKNRFVTLVTVGCESDYHLVDGICMKISGSIMDLMKTWTEAAVLCEYQGAKLALIRSQAQDDFLTANGGGFHIWIDAVFCLGRTHFYTTNLSICYFFGPEKFWKPRLSEDFSFLIFSFKSCTFIGISCNY